MNELSKNEQDIIQFLRDARPYEKITIQKDNKGQVDNYIITREQKVMLTSILVK